MIYRASSNNKQQLLNELGLYESFYANLEIMNDSLQVA